MKNYSKLLEELSVDDLPNEGLRMLATDCGKELVIRLLQGVPGQGFVVPERPRNSLTPIADVKDENERLKQLEAATSESWRIVAEECGVDVVLSLFEHAKGASFYVPKSGLSAIYKSYVVRNYNGHNARNLALALRITQSQVYRILNAKIGPVKRQQPIPSNQINMFRSGTHDA
jgi:Mor family transcriptional regulator